MTNLDVGKRIKTIRKENKLTLENFGKLFNPPASKGLVSNWEKGDNLPNKKRLERIAEIGKVSVPYLLEGRKSLEELSVEEIHELNADTTMKLHNINEIIKKTVIRELDETKNNIKLDKLSPNEIIYLEKALTFMNHGKSQLFLSVIVLLSQLNNSIEISTSDNNSVEEKQRVIELYFEDLLKEFPNYLLEGKKELFSKIK